MVMNIISSNLGMIAAIVAAFFVLAIIKSISSKNNKASRIKESDDALIAHKPQTHLTTDNERKFYFELKKALPERYQIHCQTSLIAIVVPVEFKDKKRAYTRRVDYVITDQTTKIIAVIELDDSSHNSEKAKKRDHYINNAVREFYPLYRFNTEKVYDSEKIAAALTFLEQPTEDSVSDNT